MLSGTNVEYAHQYNKRIILETIRQHDTISKAELSRHTGLTTQAISNIVERFLDAGIVEVRGKQSSRRGQPAQLLGLRAQGGYSAGLHLDRDHLTGVLLDLSGHALARTHLEWHVPTPDQALPEVLRALQALLDHAGLEERQLWGVGISLPGPIEAQSGRLMSPPNLRGWNGTVPRAWLEQRTGVPVYVETDSTAAAIGERWFGAGRPYQNLFYIYLGMGVGGGLLADGQPFRGATGAAAMFGHTPAGSEQRPCPCGGTDCLELYLSIPALLRDLQPALGPALTLEDVVTSLGRGEPAVSAWLDHAADRLARSVAGVKALLDPEVVIMGGRWPAPLLDALLTRTRAATQRYEPKIVAPTRILAAELSDDAALGAATIALFNSVTPYTEVMMKVRHPGGPATSPH
ncbi:ROK family transcriptional regulator [uncultured Deinococcus sp.]|uniref:ROK family transcriptional regulator n=1 Tax=uncultured Deinococcus sp. TaxID=158789 RepID=UPI0025D77A30|nr:ROK family transcriptional regulator [uncultured Deinococcus sp.]